MNRFTGKIQSSLSVIIFLLFNAHLQAAQESPAFTPPEVAVGTVSCKADWNQFCEDQKTIKVPDGHKLCKNTVIAKEKTGDSAYEIVSTDKQSVTVKFNAKGNRDRLKQQGASIVLNISLLGVRDNVDCITGLAPPVVTTAPEPKTVVVAVKPEIKPVEIAAPAPVVPAPAVPAPVATTREPRPHACACSQGIDADKVFNCLATGHGRDNVKCDSYATTIQCVTSKDECRESQKENCPQVFGLNKTTSTKRIFIPDSPYCQQP